MSKKKRVDNINNNDFLSKITPPPLRETQVVNLAQKLVKIMLTLLIGIGDWVD